jgi:hypothetical protein
MANYQVVRAAHKTLTGTAVDRVEVTGGHAVIEVVNRSTTDVLYVATAAPGVIPADPTAAADGLDVVLPGERVPVYVGQVTPSVSKYVKVIGNSNPYSVLGTIGKV